MYDLKIQGLSTHALIEMADGLALAGEYGLARNLYAFGLAREANTHLRYRLRLRLGILAAPTRDAGLMVRTLKELEATRSPVFVGSGLATWHKTVPFLDDERFMALADKHADLLPIANWHWNLHTVLWAVQRSALVEGDLMELGVFKGHTTLFVAEYLEFQNSSRRWWLYDTFEGIPEDQTDPGWEDANARAYTGRFSYEEVVARFSPFPNIDVIRGRVPEILDERCPERIAFLHMDLNNTAAEIAALDALYDRISPGGVIIFDDFGWASARAQFDAERKWFADRGLQILPLATGQGLFIKP